jgi:hypothetical protein
MLDDAPTVGDVESEATQPEPKAALDGDADVQRLEELEVELAELDAALAAFDAAVEAAPPADGSAS